MYNEELAIVLDLRRDFARAMEGDYRANSGLCLQPGRPAGVRWKAYGDQATDALRAVMRSELGQARLSLKFARYGFFLGTDLVDDVGFWQREQAIDEDVSKSALQRAGARLPNLMSARPPDEVVKLEADYDDLSTESRLRQDRYSVRKALFDGDETPRWADSEEAGIFFHGIRRTQQMHAEENASHLIDLAKLRLGYAAYIHADLLPHHRGSEAMEWRLKANAALSAGARALDQGDGIYRSAAPRLAAFGRRVEAARRCAKPDPSPP